MPRAAISGFMVSPCTISEKQMIPKPVTSRCVRCGSTDLSFRGLGTEQVERIAALQDDDYRAHIERGMLVHVEAFDWNCPQHITPRYTEGELHAANQLLRDQIAALERELAVTRSRVSGATASDQ